MEEVEEGEKRQMNKWLNERKVCSRMDKREPKIEE